jgi:HPt (histidine-containing phosphotransfer) domain-containing protein
MNNPTEDIKRMLPPVIDSTTFEELKAAMGEDFIPELISTYLEETAALLQTLREALAANRPEDFRRAAHSIKSSSASLGALDFSAQAKELEFIGKAGDLSQAGEPLVRLETAFPAVTAALQALLP